VNAKGKVQPRDHFRDENSFDRGWQMRRLPNHQKTAVSLAARFSR